MPQRYLFHLTDDELKELTVATKDKRPEVKRRAKALLMLHKGSTPDAVRKAFNLHSRTSFFNWGKRWQEGGREGLARRPQSGRPRRADTAYRDQLDAITVMEPKALGHELTGWTAAALNDAMREKTGVTLSDHRFRHLLHEMGYAYQRLPRPPCVALKFPRTREELWQSLEQPQQKDTYGWRKKLVV